MKKNKIEGWLFDVDELVGVPLARDRVVGLLETKEDGLPGTHLPHGRRGLRQPEIHLVETARWCARGEEIKPRSIRVGDEGLLREVPHPERLPWYIDSA